MGEHTEGPGPGEPAGDRGRQRVAEQNEETLRSLGAGCFRSLLFVFVLFVDLAHLVNEATRELGECQSASCTARSAELVAIGAAVLGFSLLSCLVGCVLLASGRVASRPTWPLLLAFLLAFAAQIVGVALAAYGGAVVQEPAG